jgi:hypothetical protein|tara:strand:- start:1560 stop:2642 length:1083 start_codon:yes stop_codon:yes gene_type:complete
MENKNIQTNLLIKQMLQSDNMAYVPGYISSRVNVDFGVLNKAYQDTGKIYAKLKAELERGTCGDCILENKMLIQLQAAPQVSLEFIQNVMGELQIVETSNYDPNNYYGFMVANCIISKKPGFSKTDGYDMSLQLLDNGAQELMFNGPLFEQPLIINSAALQSLLDSDTSMVVETPDINKGMTELLVQSGLFMPENVGEDGQLSASAKISEEFILKFNGEPDYEIIDIGGGKGRNILKYDTDKIERKLQPFINAEVAGILSAEQEAIAAWNVYLAKLSSVEEDDQMVQNANAGDQSWSYTEDLPLYQDKKIIFAEKYKQFFIKNYLVQFLTNKLPSVEEDAAVFDLQEGIEKKASKIMGNQ